LARYGDGAARRLLPPPHGRCDSEAERDTRSAGAQGSAMSPEPKINPDLRLAEAFGHYVERWAAEHRAPAAVCAMVRRAAVHLSTATSTGHVCLYLSGLAASLTAEDARVITPGELREALLESGLVGSRGHPTPGRSSWTATTACICTAISTTRAGWRVAWCSGAAGSLRRPAACCRRTSSHC